MNDDDIERLIEGLWGKGPDLVYVIVDGARDPAIQSLVESSDLPHRCLFSGALNAALAQAAPYLVQLKRSSPFLKTLLRRGWGQSFGIFLSSPSSLEALRRHFRRFLRVQDARGKTLYFRYYDPRVLRVYLPTCEEGEVLAFFGPVTRFLVEAADPRQILVGTRVGPRVDLGLVDWSKVAPGDPQSSMREG